MRFTPLSVDGAFRVDVAPHADERGSFARAWCAGEFAEHGLETSIAQMNVSRNVRAGTLRGLHYQQAPRSEAKFFRCLRGRSYHVMVDVRPQSPTYLAWCGVELSAERMDAVFLPAGTAAGYQALEDDTAVLYSTSTAYLPGVERGIRWNDPAFAITWPLADRAIVSAKDAAWEDFEAGIRPSTIVAAAASGTAAR